jgi:hypothetical protein
MVLPRLALSGESTSSLPAEGTPKQKQNELHLIESVEYSIKPVADKKPALIKKKLLGFYLYYFISQNNVIPINFYLADSPLESNILTIIDKFGFEKEIQMNLKQPLNFLNFLRE